MHWLLQRKFEYDKNYLGLIENLERMEIPHTYCKVVPFTDDGIEYETEPPNEGTRCFASGSYTLAKIAKKYYEPGSYISPQLNMDNLYIHFKNEMFNDDLLFGSLDEIEPGIEKFFIRPVEDTKSFTGQIMTSFELEEFKRKIKSIPNRGYK